MPYDIIEWLYDRLGDETYETKEDLIEAVHDVKAEEWLRNNPGFLDFEYEPDKRSSKRAYTGKTLQTLLDNFSENKIEEYEKIIQTAETQGDLAELPPNSHLRDELGGDAESIIAERDEKASNLQSLEEEFEERMLNSIGEASSLHELDNLKNQSRDAITVRSENKLLDAIRLREDQLE